MKRWLAVLLMVPYLLAAQTSDSVEPTEETAAAEGADGGSAEGAGGDETDGASDEDAEEPEVRITPEELAAEALEIAVRKAALEQLELRVTEEIGALRELQVAALAVLEPERAARDEELAKLVGFYSNMKPKQAAQLIENLPLELATDVISRMKRREAGKILNVMARGRAVEISKRMTRKPQ